jgi:hypothetical protein
LFAFPTTVSYSFLILPGSEARAAAVPTVAGIARTSERVVCRLRFRPEG